MAIETARLLISCPDARGIIAAVAGFVADYSGNILEADQHSDPQHVEDKILVGQNKTVVFH